MTLKKLARAGLIAAALSALTSVFFVSAPMFDHSAAYAQAPAAAPAAPAEADAPPPACAPNADAAKAVLTNCTPNSGDTAWMLTSVALVLMMTIPGLGLFYGGMVRKKNVGDTVMTSFAITCLISILFLFFTYSLAFREGGEIFGVDMGWFIGGLDRAGLQGLLSVIANNKGNPKSLAPTNPVS